jgi:hypothetical protein
VGHSSSFFAHQFDFFSLVSDLLSTEDNIIRRGPIRKRKEKKEK